MRYSFTSKLLICFFTLAKIVANPSDYKFEGIWQDCDQKRLFFMSFFLPFNPAIVFSKVDLKRVENCQNYWEYATIKNLKTAMSCDLLWVEEDELTFLKDEKKFLQNAKVIYTTTHFQEESGHYESLRSFLEYFGYTLAAHWYWEKEGGHAVFVKKNIFDAAMRTLNYSPSGKGVSSPSFYPLKKYFKKTKKKRSKQTLSGIDYIYMINIDQRPEKFEKSVRELNLYEISPHRFSAVNGWELSPEVFAQVGMKIFSTKEMFYGTTYKHINEKVYLSNEWIVPDGQAYFLLGMSQGSIGIVLSHLSVLQDAYDEGFETIWVMEDDIKVIENPSKIYDLIEKLDKLVPNWDIFFTDIDTKDKTNQRIACRALAARPNFAIKPLEFYLSKFYPINDELFSVGMRYGAYSMIVRRSGMKKILDHFKMYGIFQPYDMDFWLIEDLQMFRPAKDIVSTRIDAATDNHAPLYSKARTSSK